MLSGVTLVTICILLMMISSSVPIMSDRIPLIGNRPTFFVREFFFSRYEQYKPCKLRTSSASLPRLINWHLIIYALCGLQSCSIQTHWAWSLYRWYSPCYCTIWPNPNNRIIKYPSISLSCWTRNSGLSCDLNRCRYVLLLYNNMNK